LCNAIAVGKMTFPCNLILRLKKPLILGEVYQAPSIIPRSRSLSRRRIHCIWRKGEENGDSKNAGRFMPVGGMNVSIL